MLWILTALLASGEDHWAFRPVERPAVPDGAGDPIDRFLRSRGDEFSPPADRRVLLRRASFVLTGLPPSPGEIDAFAADPSPDAFVRQVDRLLASPRFGERWGRHWLDVARYADSCGGGGNYTFDLAWRYRDYVIDALNKDLPFNRFVMEQIAGDLLDPDAMAATGFLVLGEKELLEYDKEKLRMDVVDEQVDAVGRVFMGLTLGCARCHDHAFDPVTTRDYYALAGFFRSTESFKGSGWIHRKSGTATVMAVRDVGNPADCRILRRGNPHDPGDPVPRGFPSVLATASPKIPAGASGRLELARWIARADNPLTARVIVNRLWHHLFGEGLVRTVDNFGKRGATPSHPELLDWLAAELVNRGWSLKSIIRRIVLTRAWRQAGRRRRLEAEAIRDAILSAAGRLDLRMGGSTMTFKGRIYTDGNAKNSKLKADPWRRRTVYLPVYRGALPIDLLHAFDFVHPGLVSGRRRVSTRPAQALFMMNSPFVRENARAAADRAGSIDRVWRTILGRGPSVAERDRVRGYKLHETCQALFASTEFLFMD